MTINTTVDIDDHLLQRARKGAECRCISLPIYLGEILKEKFAKDDVILDYRRNLNALRGSMAVIATENIRDRENCNVP